MLILTLKVFLVVKYKTVSVLQDLMKKKKILLLEN